MARKTTRLVRVAVLDGTGGDTQRPRVLGSSSVMLRPCKSEPAWAPPHQGPAPPAKTRPWVDPDRRGPIPGLLEMNARFMKVPGAVARVASRHSTTAMVVELALVPVVACLVLLALGVTLWTKPLTPDSEFYFTLGAFGSDVTDGAAQAAYYWTRVGVVVPLRGLISAFGVDWGYRIWHFVLIGVALAPSYDLIRRLVGRVAAIAGALFILLNLVFLTTLGNTYVTSAIVPLFIAECALLAAAVTATTRRRRTVSLALVGVCVGWVAACNQLAVILALGLALVGIIAIPRNELRRTIGAIGAAAWAAASIFLAFVFLGSIVFPKFNWWETTRFWTGLLKLSDYHSDDLTWLWTNPALLVPVLLAIGVAALGLKERGPMQPVLMLTGLLTGVGIAFGAWYQFVADAGFLEFQAYSPYLWGPALTAGAVGVGILVKRSAPAPLGLAIIAAGLFAGAWFPVGDGIRLWPLGILLALTAVVLMALVNGSRTEIARFLVPAACFLVPFVVQYLQSATGNPAGLKFARAEYHAVLRGNDFHAEYMQDLAVARWVLAQPGLRKYMVWTANSGLGGSGAMLFLGPNSVSLDSTITPQGTVVTRAIAPSHIILLGQTEIQLDQIRRTLRTVATKVTPGPCKLFLRKNATFDVRACVARVTFVR